MKPWLKMILFTLGFGIPAFFLGPVLWPPSAEVAPSAGQLPFFLFISLVQALVFGFGIWFIFQAYPHLKKLGGDNKITMWAYISISWILVSWWPHDNLHIQNGLNLQGLLYIEYGFHFTLIIAAVLIALYFLYVVQSKSKTTKR